MVDETDRLQRSQNQPAPEQGGREDAGVGRPTRPPTRSGDTPSGAPEPVPVPPDRAREEHLRPRGVDLDEVRPEKREEYGGRK